VTLETRERLYGVLHFGGLDFHCQLKSLEGGESFGTLKKELFTLYRQASLGDVYDRLKTFFQGNRYQLKDLFPREREKLIGTILKQRMNEYYTMLREWAREDEGTLRKLADLNMPIPLPMKTASQLSFDFDFMEALEETLASSLNLDSLTHLMEHARDHGYTVKSDEMARTFKGKLEALLLGLPDHKDPENLFGRLGMLLKVSELMGIPLDLWAIQNRFLDACLCLDPPGPEVKAAYEAFSPRIGIPSQVIPWKV
jgi:hypothetical protein